MNEAATLGIELVAGGSRKILKYVLRIALEAAVTFCAKASQSKIYPNWLRLKPLVEMIFTTHEVFLDVARLDDDSLGLSYAAELEDPRQRRPRRSAIVGFQCLALVNTHK